MEIRLGNAVLMAEQWHDIAALANKLKNICASVERLPKRGNNQTQGYKFVREGDAVEYIRPKLAEEGLFLFFSSEPGSVKYEHRINRKDNNQVWAEVELRAVVIDTHSGALASWTMPGQAVDTGSDKAIYKAITGAKKYDFLTAFNIATADDPENPTREPRDKRRGENETQEPIQLSDEAAKRKKQAIQKYVFGKFPEMTNEGDRHRICAKVTGIDSWSELSPEQAQDVAKYLEGGGR